MFDALFTSLGPLGATLSLLGIVAVLFVIAGGETLRLAAPALRVRWATAWDGAPRSLRRIARALGAGDSQPRHAFSLRDFVHRHWFGHRG